jgi:hypothetical protein
VSLIGMPNIPSIASDSRALAMNCPDRYKAIVFTLDFFQNSSAWCNSRSLEFYLEVDYVEIQRIGGFI